MAGDLQYRASEADQRGLGVGLAAQALPSGHQPEAAGDGCE